MIRAFSQRQRMRLAWGLIALLLIVILVREVGARWAEMSQWRGLAEVAAGLEGGPALSLEDLRQSAQARHIQLTEIEPQDEGWQVRGSVADEQTLLAWLQALQIEGAQPLQWGMEQQGKRLRFDLQVRP
ncbi:type II secretion system protein GspM [Pseudomonas putida]|uniref:type II secretion system protein GspM n=1 Tax=Pseudomonas putida TaxID=303 RepID=UPI0008190763|nr:type II secretion system protein GspM [Pseudomonas putida]OCT24085.1 type II secretion system protein GspM [Pseudomonas putida]OCT27164.1 type II secretion system protein GspM [Pseudomonas putida]OCT28448.1 type II secretion system protein GspM [Pseudomonas putida]OCT38319.1 type II secretion system protein GspM [Pseudomonas putida]